MRDHLFSLPEDAEKVRNAVAGNGFHAARRALEAYVEDEDYPSEVCLNAGTAVELLVKACLFAKSPALIMDNRLNDVALQSIIGLRRFGPGLDFPTCSFAEAMKRMRWGWPNFPYTDARDRALLDNRNSSAHSGIVDNPCAATSIRIMIRLVDWIRTVPMPELGFNDATASDRFWNRYSEMVEQVRLDDSNSSSIRALGLIADAQTRYHKRYNGIPDAQKSILFHSLLDQHLRRVESHGVVGEGEVIDGPECPACGQEGIRHSEVEEVDFVMDYDGLKPIGGSVLRKAMPISFDCPVCDLSLWKEEMAVASLGESYDLGWLSIG